MKAMRIVAIVATLVPGVALANAGVGFLMLSLPILLPGLLPIVVVEAPILKWKLRLTWRRSLWVSLLANLGSLFAGGLLAIAFDLLVLGSMQVSGLEPYRAAFLISLAPMFFITWWIESRIVRRMQGGDKTAGSATFMANAASYALLAAAVVALAPPVSTSSVWLRMRLVATALREEGRATEVQHQSTRTFPAPGLSSARVKDVESIQRQGDGALVARLSFPEVPALDGKSLIMRPRLQDGRIAGWECLAGDIPRRYLPIECRNPAGR